MEIFQNYFIFCAIKCQEKPTLNDTNCINKGRLSGAGDRTRTGTLSPAADFESATSTISSHRQVCISFSVTSRRWRFYCGRLAAADVAFVCGTRRMSLVTAHLRPSPTAAPAAPSLASATGGARARTGGF